MTGFEKIFNDWIQKRTRIQIKIIEQISNESGVDYKSWFFDNYLKRQISSYSGDGILDNLLEDFISYVSCEFSKLFKDYIKSSSKNIYGEDIYDISICLKYNNVSDGLIIDTSFESEEDIREYENKIKSLTLEQKGELIKNKLFSYIITKTKLNIFSIKDIRALKLKNIHD